MPAVLDAKRLIDKRANSWEQAKALLDTAESEDRGLSAEEQAKWDRIMADIDALDERRKNVEAAMQAEADAAEALRRLNSGKLEPAANGGVSAEEEAVRAFMLGTDPSKRALEMAPPRLGVNGLHQRTLSKLSAGAGANTVPTSFYDRLVEHMIEVSGLLQGGPTLLQTTSGENIEIPKTTSHSTAALTAEAAAITASDPAFGKVTLGAYKYAVLVQVSTELLTDTAVDLLGYLGRQAGRAVGNAFGVDLAVGNGTNKPNGLVTAATTGVTGSTGVTGAFTADNLIDLHYSVIAPYRNSPSCAWLMRDSTMGNVRKLKDSAQGYLWAPSLAVGQPDTILGKPVRTDPNIAAVALSAKSVLFGDLSAYFVRLAGGVRWERSDEYAFANDLVTFRCIVRGDGNLVDVTGAVKSFAGAGT